MRTAKEIYEKEQLGEYEESFPSFLHQVMLFISRKERLQLLRAFERLARNEVITKACRWLRANTQIYAYEMYDTDLVRMIEDFRKDMEEE